MRLAMRALIVLSLPLVAFGWLATAVPGPPADPPENALLLVGVGVLLVLARGMLLSAWEFVLTFRLGVPAPRVSAFLGVLVLVAAVSMIGYEPFALLVTGITIAVVAAVFFAVQLAAIVLVRALVGMWQQSELPLWPGRRVATGVLLAAVLAATPVQSEKQSGFGSWSQPRSLIPLVEKVRLDVVANPFNPVFTYPGGYDSDTGGLLGGF